jgi:uncharacterized protein DUF4255
VANVLAVHSVGASLATYLRNSYPDALRVLRPCEFRLVSSGELAGTPTFGTTLSLYLFRVTQNEHLRNLQRRNDPLDGSAPLAVDLHYLMTVWADDALAEHMILAWAMRQFHLRPVLDVSSLSPEAGWTPADFVQVIPAELSHEELMRIWEALDPAYRLSVSYIARVVRIDLDTPSTSLPVVATRLSFTDREAAP